MKKIVNFPLPLWVVLVLGMGIYLFSYQFLPFHKPETPETKTESKKSLTDNYYNNPLSFIRIRRENFWNLLNGNEKNRFYQAFIHGFNNSSLTIANPNDVYLERETQDLFYSWERIKSEINLLDEYNNREKTIRIYQYLKDHTSYLPPLYDVSNQITNPVYHFSVFQFGFCGQFAKVSTYLYSFFDFTSRALVIPGHVLPEVFYEGKWHAMDDSNGNGLLQNSEGEILSFEDILKEYDDSDLKFAVDDYSQVFFLEENWFKETQVVKNNEVKLDFYPFEKKYLLSDLFFISSDSLHILNNLNRTNVREKYGENMGTYVRVIPVKSVPTNDDQVSVIRDFFPITSLTIVSNQEIEDELMPGVQVQSEELSTMNRAFFAKSVEVTPLAGKFFYNYPAAIMNMELHPTHSITLTNLDKLGEFYPDAEIVTTHLYAKRNQNLNLEKVQSVLGSDLIYQD